MAAAWEQHSHLWTPWARQPGHDSYWRFGRDAFLPLLPPAGRLTLDLGCGEGRLSRDLRQLGHRVVSIDRSPTLMRDAWTAAPGLPAVLADLVALPFPDRACDLVVAYMSLHDVEGMEAAVAEAARVLEPGGHLCLAIVHPLNSAGAFTSRAPDAAFEIQGSYLEPHDYVDEVERDGLRMVFTSRHRPVEEYFKALEAAGLVVERLREVPGDNARWRRLPLFLDLRAVKLR
ncbi:MAG: methyltransferase domain-containing protein [Candidatus Dormibacteraeota bacterium]|nr:methyltransferase domain-containing protein [Candidatus Dormibacteraeota bacterium]